MASRLEAKISRVLADASGVMALLRFYRRAPGAELDTYERMFVVERQVSLGRGAARRELIAEINRLQPLVAAAHGIPAKEIENAIGE